jgi:hypothetical protein
MTKKFTSEDLLRYAYEETDSFTEAEIAHSVGQDEALQEELLAIEQVKEHLDADMKRPSASSLKIIMDYSRESNKELQTSR